MPAESVRTLLRADRPKQSLDLCGRSLLERSLDCFLDHPRLRGLAVSLAPEDPWWPTLPCATDARILRAPGGRERADSVLGGLLLLAEQGATDGDWVLVHDAARPNLRRDDLDRLLAELAQDPVGGLLGVPARDTLKRVERDGRGMETPDGSQASQVIAAVVPPRYCGCAS